MTPLILQACTALIVGSVLFYWIFVKTTQTMHYRAKMRLGVFVKIVHEGPCIRIPILHSLSPERSLQTEQHTIKVSTTTKDKVAVELLLNIAIRVQPGKEEQAMFNLVDPVPQIESHVGKVAFARVPSMDLDALYGDTKEIVDAVAEELKTFLNDNGYDILSVNLNGISLPKSVQDSRDSVYENTQRQIAAKAAGETAAIVVLAKAEAEKEEKKLDGEGIGDERTAIADASVEAITLLGEALELEEATDEDKKKLRFEITRLLNRQLERDTLVKVGTSTGTVLMFPHNLGVTDDTLVAPVAPAAAAAA